VKALLTLIVPASLTLLAAAFWKRSVWFGMGVLTFIALSKILWSIVFGGESASALLPPAVIGLAICNAAVYFGVKWVERRQHREAASPSA
jgi:4-hydroxybenzoate polyprenyltransferase